MSGPLPKPAERRQRRNRPALVSLPMAGSVPSFAPDPPHGLLLASVAAWSALWSSPVASTYLPSDLPALRRLFELLDERERAFSVARDGRLTEGSKGQPVLNPLLAYVGDLATEIRALEDRFGLTPRARMQLGIAFGEAHRSLDALNAAFLEGTDADQH
jgi:P27 family predicted phage terminase small subunit